MGTESSENDCVWCGTDREGYKDDQKTSQNVMVKRDTDQRVR